MAKWDLLRQHNRVSDQTLRRGQPSVNGVESEDVKDIVEALQNVGINVPGYENQFRRVLRQESSMEFAKLVDRSKKQANKVTSEHPLDP